MRISSGAAAVWLAAGRVRVRVHPCRRPPHVPSVPHLPRQGASHRARAHVLARPATSRHASVTPGRPSATAPVTRRPSPVPKPRPFFPSAPADAPLSPASPASAPATPSARSRDFAVGPRKFARGWARRHASCHRARGPPSDGTDARDRDAPSRCRRHRLHRSAKRPSRTVDSQQSDGLAGASLRGFQPRPHRRRPPSTSLTGPCTCRHRHSVLPAVAHRLSAFPYSPKTPQGPQSSSPRFILSSGHRPSHSKQ